MRELDMRRARLKQLQDYEKYVQKCYGHYSTQQEILNQVRGEINEVSIKIKQLESSMQKIKCI